VGKSSRIRVLISSGSEISEQMHFGGNGNIRKTEKNFELQEVENSSALENGYAF
jgi:hypothetical protein